MYKLVQRLHGIYYESLKTTKKLQIRMHISITLKVREHIRWGHEPEADVHIIQLMLIVRLAITRGHLFLEFWLVNTSIFAHPRDHRAATLASKKYAS